MKQPRTKICAFLAAIFFIGGTLLNATGDFYAAKWGEVVRLVGGALGLALIIEYGLEMLWHRKRTG